MVVNAYIIMYVWQWC